MLRSSSSWFRTQAFQACDHGFESRRPHHQLLSSVGFLEILNGEIGVRLFDPYFNSAFYPYPCFGLHQFYLCLNESVVLFAEFFFDGVLKHGYRNVLLGTDLVPEIGLDFFSFLEVFLDPILCHSKITLRRMAIHSFLCDA